MRALMMGTRMVLLALVALTVQEAAWSEDMLALNQAVIVQRAGVLPNAENAAATVLSEELERRTGISLPVTTAWPEGKPVIAITSEAAVADWERTVPPGQQKAEGYRLLVEAGNSPVVWIIGADARGALYGVGELLRQVDWAPGKAQLPMTLDIATAPTSSIRGHQLGYRHRANSWDAWTPEQFDQYIREMAFFGINAIENIPFEDSRQNPMMKRTREEMNRELSSICARYGMDYWVWTPADFDLNDEVLRAKMLDKHEAFYNDCETLSAVFFPGGDPGHNPPELVLPFLEDIAERLMAVHPDARVWLSLQWFNKEQILYIIDYLETESPDWLGGLCAGPSSPPIPLTRQALPKKYRYRLYPDITHNKLCQYPVPWWDTAFALTLGREAINPRPAHYTYIHNWFAPYSDGFITYSDGVHDDVNKTIWSALGWDQHQQPRAILVDYCRVYFDPAVAEAAADAILALERNWRGALIDNGAVEGTLLLWQQLEAAHPHLKDNWRWQMCMVRAYYDAYIRHRLIAETRLEEEANAILLQAESRGAAVVMKEAMDVLNRAVTHPASPELRQRIVDLCEDLFQSIQLQTSVEKYNASGAERGAFLDFVDYPMNNRWWLEDEFKKITAMATEAEKCARLHTIATWENPGPGSYYDDIGNPAKSDHVLHSDFHYTSPGEEAQPEPTLWWMDNGMSRTRLSWQSTMNFPEAVIYEGLDPDADYLVRVAGYGQSLLRIDGDRVEPSRYDKGMGEFKEFPVPASAKEDRKITITWDRPTDEGHLNWRQCSRVAEIWLLKQ